MPHRILLVLIVHQLKIPLIRWQTPLIPQRPQLKPTPPQLLLIPPQTPPSHHLKHHPQHHLQHHPQHHPLLLPVMVRLSSTPPGRMVGSPVVSMAMLRKTPLPLPHQKVPLLAPPREVTMTQP